MTDAELIARARLAQRYERNATGELYADLADRIEELLAERKKAVDAFVDLAIATLAEIKGESHDPL